MDSSPDLGHFPDFLGSLQGSVKELMFGWFVEDGVLHSGQDLIVVRLFPNHFFYIDTVIIIET